MKAEDLERMNIERRRAYHRVGLAVESGSSKSPTSARVADMRRTSKATIQTTPARLT